MSELMPYIFEFEDHFFLSGTEQVYSTLELLFEHNRAAFKGRKQVVFIRENPMRLLKLSHAEKLSDHDLIAALSYECASLMNLGSDEVALSLIRHDDPSPYPTDYFLSSFEREMLVARMKVFQKYHLKSMQFLSLDQALFLTHFKQPSTQKTVMFLLLEERTVAIIPQEGENYHVRNLNMGAQDLRSNPTQFLTQVKRRLSLDETQTMVMYAPKALLPLQNQIQALLQLSLFQAVALESILGTLAKDELEKNICATPIELTTPPRPIRTLLLLLGVILLLFTGLFVHYFTILNRNVLLKEELTLRQQMNQTFESRQAQITQLKKRLFELEKQYRFFQHHAPFNISYFTVIQLLSRYKLYHSRVVSVSLEGEAVIILGESQDQADFTKFITHFQAELQKENLRLYMQEFSSTNDVNFKSRSQTQIAPTSQHLWEEDVLPLRQGQSMNSNARWQFKFSISKEATP